jgi:anti-sigma regulatory factor (Ser/Thr protein kinase)
MAQDEVRIEVPVRATMTESYQLVELCGRAENESGEVVLDCGRTTRFGPFGIAALASTIAMRRKTGRKSRLALPVDVEAARFASEVGLDKFAEGATTGIGTLEVRQMTDLDAVYTGAVTDILVRGVPGITEENSYPIELCLNELLQNVFEWAESSVGCFVLARWYHRTRSVQMTVVDRGIGIPAALRRSKVRDLHRASDANVIEAAVTMPLLTSRATQVGGLGLKNIREVVALRGGRLTVLSLTAKVTWSGDKIHRAVSPGFRGTAVEIDFQPNAPVERPSDYVSVF